MLLQEFRWFIHAILFILLVYIGIKMVTKMFHIKFNDFLREALNEFKDFYGRKPTIGTINVIGLLFVTFLGLVIISSLEIEQIFTQISHFIGKGKADYLHKSPNFEYLLVADVVVFISSIIVVLADKQLDRKRYHNKR